MRLSVIVERHESATNMKLEAQISGALSKTLRLSPLLALTYSHSLSYAVYMMRWLALTVHACQYARLHLSAVPSAESLNT